MTPRLCSALAGLLLVTSLSAVAAGLAKCPSGLKCQAAKKLPIAQRDYYNGNAYECLARAFGGSLPPLDLNSEMSLIFHLYNGAVQGLAASPAGLEMPYELRFDHLYNLGLYAALTAYHPTAVPALIAPGFGLPFATRIAGDGNTTYNRNVALGYAFYRMTTFISWASPTQEQYLGDVLVQAGLDPNYTNATNLTDPRDIGNAAAAAVYEFQRTMDNWNQQGTIDNPNAPVNFSDYTGFIPHNSPYLLSDITKWQPLVEVNSNGYVTTQEHVAAQLGGGRVPPYETDDVAGFYKNYTYTKPPRKEQSKMTAQDLRDFKAEVDKVLHVSANLNDRQKIVAEFFDTKVVSFGFTPLFDFAIRYNWTQYDSVFFFLGRAVIYDATLVAWYNKMRFNAIRPTSAIHYIYPNTNVTAYGGQGKGTQTFPGREFASYLRTPPASDYPSGGACMCVGFGEYTDTYLNAPMNLEFNFPQGCSMKEPGLTPAQDTLVQWTTTEGYIRDCSQSRVWGGVQFQKSVDAALDLCRGMGKTAVDRVKSLVAGNP